MVHVRHTVLFGKDVNVDTLEVNLYDTEAVSKMRHCATEKGCEQAIMHIPPEIVALILQHLGDHTLKAHKSCALVCKDWLPLAQQHLFRRLHLFLDNQDVIIARLKRLLVILGCSPHLARHFRDITVLSANQIIISQAFCDIVVLVLQHLARVQQLVLIETGHHDPLPGPLLYVLQQVVSRPGFEELRFYRSYWTIHVDTFLSLLRSCSKSLRRVRIFCTSLSGASTMAIAPAVPWEFKELANLEEFEMDGLNLVSVFSADAFSMANLRTYTQTILVSSMDGSNLPSCMPTTIQSLKFVLYCHLLDDPSGTCGAPDIRPFTHLRFLSIQTDLTDDCAPRRGAAVLPYIGHFLDNTPCSNLMCLERLTITIIAEEYVAEDDWDQTGWDALDSRLSRLVEVGAFRQLLLSLRRPRPREQITPESGSIGIIDALERVKGRFVELSRSNSMTVTIRPLCY